MRVYPGSRDIGHDAQGEIDGEDFGSEPGGTGVSLIGRRQMQGGQQSDEKAQSYRENGE